MVMKGITRKTLAGLLALVIILSPLSAPAYAYVGAMSQNVGGVTSGQQDGYYYLKNDYIGFYIRPGGNLTTVPSQKTLNDVKNIGATESHIFYKQTGIEIWNTDYNSAVGAGSSSVTIDLSNAANPKLRQILTVPAYNSSVTVTYELVQLDAGKATDTTGEIVGKDASDSGRTWGVLASASASFADADTRLLWTTRHNNFGGVGHSLLGTVRLDRFTTTYATEYPYNSTTTYYSAPISSGLNRSDAEGISEAYTDSFSYANQFVALQGYMRSKSWASDGGVPTLLSGIRGHWNNYASAVSYAPASNSLFSIEHEFSGDREAYALWGFRDLYATGESGNIPADPVNIPTGATCIGIVNNNGTLSAYAAANEAALKSSYGSKLVAVFRGAFKQENGNFVFTDGAAQLSPSLTATWTKESGGLTVAANGTVTAKDVSLSAPTFKFYKPKVVNDTSLGFSFSGGKLAIDITPDNNSAILHIDIPGATCKVEGVTADLAGSLIFNGEMSISTPLYDAADITMNRLGMGWKNNSFTLNGVEASGAVDMQQLLGLDVGSASAEINSFPGEERYAFELELNVFDLFEAEGELELKRINNGALIPNTLEFKAAAETGVPLVPPVVVAEFNGLGGGFQNLADTVNGDFFAMPPLKLSVSAKGSVLEIIEGWYTIVIGPGYYQAALTDGTLLDMDIIDAYSWYTELAGDIRSYGETSYKGLKVGGGMKIDLSITSEMPFIEAGGEFNASAFAGLDNYASPTKAYLVLGADGKIKGLVRIPAEAWFINQNLTLGSAELAFALGGQTTVSVSNTTLENAVKEAFGNISGYGGVAYTGELLEFPFRIYYIFQDKKVGLEVGNLFGELDPFNPRQYSAGRMPLLDAATGEQVGIMVLNDNLTLLASSMVASTDLSFLTGDTDVNGVTITQSVYGVTIPQSVYGQSYEINIDDSAPDPKYLPFSLTPDANWTGTAEEFMSSLTVQKDGEGSPLGLVAAEFNSDNEIIDDDAANVIVGKDCITLKLPSKGTWTVSSSVTAFDISCYYASPYASLSGMSLTGTTLDGKAEDMDSEADYVLRTYLGTEEGGTDYLLCQSDVPSDGSIDEALSLSGSVAPTGSYYVTTVLLEEISGDFDGDGVIESAESAYVTTDTFAFDTTVAYTNSEQPNPPTDVTLAAIGSELMRARWKAPAGDTVDGYYLRLYQQEGNNWSETGANYLLKSSDLTPDADGYYAYDMAVTVGDKNTHLKAGKAYKVGITAFRYLADDSLPVESGEAQSDEEYLPKATYPVLSYSPTPSSDGDTMKLLCLSGAAQITVTSDVAADIVVTRMDKKKVLAPTLESAKTLTFDAPADFTGALNLKITATDATDGDITVDYLGLRFDDAAPLITMDSNSFKAERNTGAFTASGVTESGAKVTVTDIITGEDTNGAQLNAYEVTADENGVFSISGSLNPADAANELRAADSATLTIWATDTADNTSAAFANIVRAAKTDSNGGGSGGTNSSVGTSTIQADATGSIFAASLKNAAQAAGKGGTVIIQTSANAVTISGEGLQYLIANNCALQVTTAGGDMLISAGALAGLEITADSLISFTLSKPQTLSSPALQALIDDGYLVYEISILIDNKEVHTLAGTIDVTLKDKAFTALAGLRAIHILNDGTYQELDYALNGETLSFSLNSLSKVCVLDGKTAAELLQNPFSDVSASDWFYYHVLYAYRTGLMLGTAADSFGPKLNLTRAMAVTILHRLSGDTAGYKNSFTDIPSGAWYENAVAWAASNGLVKGTGAGAFSPNDPITREQLAVMLYNYAQYKGDDVSVGEDTNILSYNDALKISDYAYPALQWACGTDIINGDDQNKLNPQSSATRAEVAAILERFINK